MNRKFLSSILSSFFVLSLGFTTLTASAGQDAFQQQMTKELHESKRKLKAAEAAEGKERQRLMGEHMQTLHETMQKCRELKPRAGMSDQERTEWYAEHQKLMDQMMEQMTESHQAMMKMDCREKI